MVSPCTLIENVGEIESLYAAHFPLTLAKFTLGEKMGEMLIFPLIPTSELPHLSESQGGNDVKGRGQSLNRWKMRLLG